MTKSILRKRLKAGKHFFICSVLTLSFGMMIVIASGQHLNGKAIKLPKPVYPDMAKQYKISGTVVVAIEVDESGKVSSAKATSGPKMLHISAVDAARGARFAPNIVDGKPTKFSGTLSYSFIL